MANKMSNFSLNLKKYGCLFKTVHHCTASHFPENSIITAQQNGI